MNKIYYLIFLLSFLFVAGPLVAQDDPEDCNIFDLIPPLEQGQMSTDNPPVPCGFVSSDGSYVNECSPCGSKISDNDCISAPNPTLCELDGFTTTTSGFTNDVQTITNGFCGNGTGTHNNFWIGFTAQSNTIELLVTTFNCVPNPPNQGIQIAICETNCIDEYRTMSGGNPCFGGVGQGGLFNNSTTIDANNLVAGNEYYILVDGFAGGVCDLRIDVLDGFDVPEYSTAVNDPGQLCPDVLNPGGYTAAFGSGAIVDVNVGGIATTDLDFYWLNPAGDLIAVTDGTVISQSFVRGELDGSFFDEIGTYSVQIIDVGSCCPLCTEVALEVADPPAAAAAIISGVAGMDELNCMNEVVMLEGNPDNGSTPAAESWTIEDTNGDRRQLDVSFVQNDGRINEYEITRAIIEQYFPGEVQGEANIVYGFIEDFTQLCFGDAFVTIPFDFREPDININNPDEIDCATNPTVTLNAGATNTNNHNATYEWVAQDGSPIVDADTETPTVGNNGFYILTVTDLVNGCVSIDSVEVMGMVDPPSLTIIPDTTLNCTNNQSVEVSSTGDANGAPIVYSWEGPGGTPLVGETDPSLTVTNQGDYTLTATNTTNGCQIATSFNVALDDPSLIIDMLGDSTITCDKTEITFPAAVVNGGAGDYTYSWMDPSMTEVSTDPILTASAEGTYTLIITDTQSGCTEQAEATIALDENLPQISPLPTDLVLNCTDLMVSTTADAVDNNGAAIPNLDYEWFDGMTSIGNAATIDFNMPGTYTVVTTNPANGCSSNADVTIIMDTAEPDASIAEPADISCTAMSVTLTGSSTNTTDPLSYQWYEGAGDMGTALGINETQDVMAVGDYSLVITNTTNGCTALVTETVSSNSVAPMPDAGMDQVLNCNNQMTGVLLDGSGSTADGTIEYAWMDPMSNPTGTTAMINATMEGIYTLVVTDTDNGCDEMTTVTVTGDFAAPENVAATEGTILCGDENFVIQGSSTSTGNLEYTWTDQGMNPYDPGESLTVTSAGMYILTVTNLDNGCSSTATSEIMLDDDAPNITATLVSGDFGPINCNNPIVTYDGILTTPNSDVVITWTDPNGMVFNSSEITFDENSLQGTYDLLAVDQSNGCEAIGSVTPLYDFTEPVITTGGGTIFCAPNDEVTLSAMDVDPMANTSFTWSGTGGSLGENLANPTVSSGGMYTVVATGENGCTSQGSEMVDENSDSPSVTVAPAFDLTCNPGEDTYALNGAGTPANGTDGLTYSWSLNNMEFSTDENPSISEEGIYTLTVTNTVSNCIETATVEVGDVRTNPVPVANVQMTLNCVTPMVLLEGDATEMGVTYDWTSPDGMTVITDEQTPMVGQSGEWTLVITNPNGCTGMTTVMVEEDFELPENVMIDGPTVLTCTANTVQLMGSTSSMDISGYLWTVDEDDTYMSTETSPNVGIAGTYTLTVTGDNGCEQTATFEVTRDEGLPVVSAAPQDELTCALTSTMILGSSSAANSTFEWTGPPGFVDPGTQDIEVTRDGEYTLTVMDTDNGCEAVTTATVTLNNTDPDIATVPTTVTCADEIFSISASSMTDNVSYLWDGPLGFTDDVANPVILDPGTYTVTITDPVNGCTTMEDVIVDDARDLPEDLVAEADVTLLNCDDQNQMSTLTASSSTAGVEFTWTGDNINTTTSSSIMVDEPGIYQVEFLDPSNGCTDRQQVVIEQDITPPMISADTPDEINCQNTEVTISVTNNEAIRTYEWADPAGMSFASSGEVSPLVSAPGSYSVTVTAEDNGCTSVATVLVTADTETPISVPTSSELTCEFTTIDLMGEGSTTGPDISYEWTDANGAVISTDLNTTTDTPGEYTLTVSNSSNGCVIPETTIVGEDIADPSADAGLDDVFSCADDFVTLSGSGDGQGNLSYEWFNASGSSLGATASIDVIETGDFTLVVTDGDNGCTNMDQVTITPDEDKPVIAIAEPIVLTCDITSVDLDGSGTTGMGALSYEWTFNGNVAGTDEVISVTSPGIYTLFVEDGSNGCDNTASITVLQNIEEPDFSVTGGEIDCLAGATNVSLTGLSITNPAFSWTGPGGFTATTQDISDLDQPGDYIVTVLDQDNGCSATMTAIVTASTDTPVTSIAPVEMIDCDTEQVQLTGNADTGLSYEWTGPNILAGGNTLTPTVGEAGIYTLTVTNPTNGCEGISSIEVEEDSNFITALDAEGNDVNCFGPNTGSVEIGQVIGGTAPYVYSIDGGESFTPQQEFLGLTANQYDVVVMDINGCLFDLTLNVDPAVELVLELGENQVIAYGDSITLSPEPNFDIDIINWSDTTVIGERPSVKPVNTTSYEVTAFDEDGCIATDNITVFVEKTRPVYIPSGFSPNGDGINDFFTVYADLGLITKIKGFSVYDRWGEQMYGIEELTPAEAIQDGIGWDGNLREKEMNAGVYVYHLLVEFIDGEEIFYEGNVTLMR